MNDEKTTYGEEHITCPYCKHVNTDSWECGKFEDGFTREETCPKCEKRFRWTRHINVEYESEGLECIHCDGTGVTHEDEYENGQLVGRGTIARKCICRMKSPDDDIEPE